MSAIYEKQRGEFTLSTDPKRLDHDRVYEFLSSTYWGKQRPREVLERAMRHSLCFGVYRGSDLVGFARVITDYATYAYLADVFVTEEHRGKGVARWMIESMLAHPELTPMRRWALITRDAQKLYRQCGFTALQEPEHHMQRLEPYPGEKGIRSTFSRFAKRLGGKGSK